MVNRNSNPMPSYSWLIAGVAMILLVIAVAIPRQPKNVATAGIRIESTGGEGSKDGHRSTAPNPDETRSRFLTTIRRPAGPPVIELQEADPQGRVGSVACSTCHSVRPANLANRSPADLDQFHQNMPMAHGTLACYSCHNQNDMDTLRLADTTVVEYPDVMTLCSQCHGPQTRDYLHGAHGGMNGYWDLSRGPRTRNNCIDCHDPHVPKFPSMQPTFKPRDRFLDPATPHGDDAHQPVSTSEVEHE